MLFGVSLLTKGRHRERFTAKCFSEADAKCGLYMCFTATYELESETKPIHLGWAAKDVKIEA